MKSGNINFLEPSEPLWPVTGLLTMLVQITNKSPLLPPYRHDSLQFSLLKSHTLLTCTLRI